MNNSLSNNCLSDIVIRPLVPEDRGIIDAFYVQMSAETRALFNPKNHNRRRTHRYLDGKIPNAEEFIAVIRHDRTETVAGYCFLWDCNLAIPWLGIAVSEQWKGKGLGQHLISFLIDHVKEAGGGGILLTTHVTNTRAQALYEKMGFTFIGVHTSGEMLFLLRFPITAPERTVS